MHCTRAAKVCVTFNSFFASSIPCLKELGPKERKLRASKATCKPQVHCWMDKQFLYHGSHFIRNEDIWCWGLSKGQTGYLPQWAWVYSHSWKINTDTHEHAHTHTRTHLFKALGEPMVNLYLHVPPATARNIYNIFLVYFRFTLYCAMSRCTSWHKQFFAKCVFPTIP